jgi:hypothetical protein
MAKARRLTSLDRLLGYRNPEVIDRFVEATGIPAKEARPIFRELLRYLWFNIEAETPVNPVSVIDEMWHAFLVYTRDSGAFSKRYFGAMLHHVPARASLRRATVRLAKTNPARWRAEAAARLEAEIAIVYDGLGERIVRRWYEQYAELYPMGRRESNR